MTEPRARSFDRQPLSRRERVDQWCDEFEKQFQAGKNPRIEDWLDRSPVEDAQYLLREMIALEMGLRQRTGERVELQEYRDRFPRHLPMVESAIESIEQRTASINRASSTYARQSDQDSFTVVPTKSASSDNTNDDEVTESTVPESIGRYTIQRVLGQGTFGLVYQAFDPQLGKSVALKVPKLDRFSSHEAIEFFLDEAQSAAQLEHPGIVRVYDLQRQADFLYIVLQFIDGGDLAGYMKSRRLSQRQVVELMTAISEAVGFAHQRGFWHRDLKPANILVDSSGNPYVADFGLALHESVQRDRAGEVAGTPAYMSPEQVRGEAHRLDGRTDIWSLGVIMYEMLAGRRPFAGETRERLRDEILHRDPKPLRMIEPDISRELARICLACLAKKGMDRYQSAADLIDDLQHWMANVNDSDSASSTHQPPRVARPDLHATTSVARIIPKGLRSFDADDADFFLTLRPGPHDRNGLPKDVLFWKSRIEPAVGVDAFPVGLMYGPSGCGKSSLIKAGLLPSLSESVLPIYVEATAEDTEVRMIKALRGRCSSLPEDASLPELIARLRTDHGSYGKKVVLVLDQFEQWLHSCESYDESQMVSALRQCDGVGVQSLVMVRDDFWMSATRFMQSLEVPIVEGHNSSVVDLFDPEHAQNVLTEFGRAYGKLPESPAELSRTQSRFLERSIEGLAEEGKVVCVRLAVFAEMMKSRPWTEESLREVGGTQGVGVTFLEETFNSKTSPAAHRIHLDAVPAVLAELLPERGSDIRGEMKSYEELYRASGYAERAQDFDSLLGLLDRELLLITPTEPDEAVAGRDEDSEDVPTEHDLIQPHARYYQLTHDFLVSSLREWLARKQQETRRGRETLRLTEQASLWIAKPDARRLPSLVEWIGFQLYTDRGAWNASQTEMMQAANRKFVSRIVAWAAVIMTVVFAAYRVRYEFWANAHAKQVVQSEFSQFPVLLEQAREYQPSVGRYLQQMWNRTQTADTQPDAELQGRLALGLAFLGDVDETVAGIVADQIEDATRSEFEVYAKILPDANPQVSASLQDHWERLARPLHDVSAIDDTRSKLPPDLVERMATAGGSVYGDSAVVHALPISDFEEVASQLETVGLRPSSYRPLRSGDGISVAATWIRDGAAYEVRDGLYPEQLKAVDRLLTAKQYVIADLCQTGDPDAGGPLYSALWVKETSTEKTELFVDQLFEDYALDSARLSNNYWPLRCLIWIDKNHVPRYTSVWKQSTGEPIGKAGPTIRYAAQFGDMYPGMVATDCRLNPVDVSRFDPVAATMRAEDDRWSQDEKGRAGETEDEIRKSRARYAKYQLDAGNYPEAIREFSSLIEENRTNSRLCEYRAIAYLRAGDTDAAQAEIQRYGELPRHVGSTELLLLTRLALAEGDPDKARTHLEGIKKFSQVATIINKLARGESLIGGELLRRSDSAGELFLASSLDRLKQLAEDDGDLLAELMADADFNAVRGFEPTKQWLHETRYDRKYVAVWREEPAYESRSLLDLPFDQHLVQCDLLAAEGYLPQSISVTPASDHSPSIATSIWLRTIIPEAERAQRAARQTRIALAELFVGHNGPLKSILAGQLGNDVRNYAATQMSQWEATPELPLALLRQDEIDLETERTALVALGHFGRESFRPGDWDRLVREIQTLSTSTDRAPLRSAALWCLRRWGVTWQEEIPGQTEHADMSRDWHVNSLGQTMVTISLVVEFRMGSPSSEAFRGDSERQYWTRIGRSFSIAATETTVDQFQQFLDDPSTPEKVRDDFHFSEQYAPTEDAPQISVTYEEAVRYCQWLSRKEGIAEDQWCYPSVEDLAEGEQVELPDNFLERTGYRLPTAAEWEYACRAGESAPRFWGHLSSLTPHYAYYSTNSEYRARPVGQLAPNGFGLFDMLGNVKERCQDIYGWYQTPSDRYYRRDDFTDVRTIAVGDFDLRGGDFRSPLPNLRAAERTHASGDTRNHTVGFRVVRTAGTIDSTE